MGALAGKLRKARQFEVPIDAGGGLVLSVRRPTDLEMSEMNGAPSERWLDFVVGWKKQDGSMPNEIDLGALGGDPHPVEFDREDLAEFMADQINSFTKLVNALTTAYTEHAKSQGETAKNLQAG